MRYPKIILKLMLSTLAMPMAMAATVYEVAVMAESKSRPEIWPLVTQILMTAPRGDAVTVFDPSAGLRIATFSVSEEMANSPNVNARTTWLLKQQPNEVMKAKRFLLEKSVSTGAGDFVRWVRSLEMRKSEFANVTRVAGIFLGTPLVTSPEAYSMQNRYPSDAFLFLQDANLLTTIGKDKALSNIDVHVVHSAALSEFSERNRDFHQNKLKRFYGLFVSQMNGNLASFGGSADHLRNIVSTTYSKQNWGDADKSSTKPIIFEVISPTLERQDEGRQKNLWDGRIDKNPNAPNQQSATFDMGITWNQNVDLDIYVMPVGDIELSYKQTSGAKYKGRFVKDIMSRPGTNGFETVVYESAVPLKSIQVYVNHYSGNSTTQIEGELRVRIDGATYAKKFILNSVVGTLGRGNRDQNAGWLKIDLAQVLGIK